MRNCERNLQEDSNCRRTAYEMLDDGTVWTAFKRRLRRIVKLLDGNLMTESILR
jgi:hypothetical protein